MMLAGQRKEQRADRSGHEADPEQQQPLVDERRHATPQARRHHGARAAFVAH